MKSSQVVEVFVRGGNVRIPKRHVDIDVEQTPTFHIPPTVSVHGMGMGVGRYFIGTTSLLLSQNCNRKRSGRQKSIDVTISDDHAWILIVDYHGMTNPYWFPER